jgi:pyrroline-5-carboxylate reductase
MSQPSHDISALQIAFIGGGNMASAIMGGLIKRGLAPGQIQVVEPFAEQAAKLQSQFGVRVMAGAQASLGSAALVVWAVKPQVFSQAAAEVRTHTPGALHLSVAAGIRSDSIARWLGSERVVRAMPNTPALIGLGMTALLARPAVTAADRLIVEAVVQTTGDHLWLAQEEQLDAVTALSGSGLSALSGSAPVNLELLGNWKSVSSLYSRPPHRRWSPQLAKKPVMLHRIPVPQL